MSVWGVAKPLAGEAVDQDTHYPQGLPCFLSCCAAVVPPGPVLCRRQHPARMGSCWRKLSPGRQALLVLAHLRKGEALAELGAGFGAGTWRYVTETMRLLAGDLRAAKQAGHALAVTGGTLIPSTGSRRTGRPAPASTRSTA